MVAVVLPTRGLVFTEVIEALESYKRKCFLDIYYSYNLPIPDAQNILTDKALAKDFINHIWFVEEDTVPPSGSLEQLLEVNADIACIDYSVKGYSCVARSDKTGEVLWCGLGCTLVKRKVFENLEKPYFRTDKSLRLNDWKWISNPAKYGGLDIWFCIKAREKGFKIIQVPGECRHLKVGEYTVNEKNEGLHKIIIKEPIKKQQIIDEGR